MQPEGETPISSEYTPAGRLHTQSAPNGATTQHDYDAAGRLATITHRQSGTVVATLAYTYDANGNRSPWARIWSNVGMCAADLNLPLSIYQKPLDTTLQELQRMRGART